MSYSDKPTKFPVIKKETIDSLAKSISERNPDSNFIAETLELIDAENPILINLILLTANQTFNENSEKQRINQAWMQCLLSQYVLLRNQYEADQMNEEFV